MNQIQTNEKQTFVTNDGIKNQDGNSLDEMAENATTRRIRLRREARRKRILENAKNRLEKVNGRASGDYLGAGFDEIDQSKEYSDPEVEPDIPEALTDSLRFSNEDNTIDDYSGHNSDANKIPVFLEYRLHILLASAIAFICTVMFGDGSLVFSLFVPVMVCIMSEKFYYNSQLQPFNTSFLLVASFARIDMQSGSPLVFHFLRVIMSIQNLIFDFGIVIFFAVLSTYSLSTANDMFITLSKIK